MIHPGTNRRANRLHQLVLGLLSLQLLLSADQTPLVWAGGLLVLMGALKLRESRRTADLQRLALTEWVALGVLAVMRSDLASSLVQSLTAVLVLAALLEQEGGGQGSLCQTLGRSLRLVGAALPLLGVLFLLVPRLGPLWTVPGNRGGRSGLDAELDPGSISALALDPTPALRIRWIKGAPPAQPQRYWRVLVLDRFDGRRWSREPLPQVPEPLAAVATQLVPTQLWLAEPSPLAALPWAGVGRPSNPALLVTADGVLVGPQTDSGRRRYGISNTAALPDWRREPPQPTALALPNGSNPRLEAVASRWRQWPVQERVRAARSLFRQQQLQYTLNPQPLPAQAPLDALIYDTRRGFCEHFASAFSALMRAAAVPARVVVGYQGGTWVKASALGAGYLEVRQSDAHAWSEIWLADQGWVRVDPTAWVAPDRIRRGRSDGLANQAGSAWWQGLAHGWTQLDLAWNRWVVGFDSSQQISLLGHWRDWQGLLTMLGLSLALVPSLWWLKGSSTGPVERERQRLEQVLALLRRRGLQIRPGEDLQSICARACRSSPELVPQLQRLAATYQQLRFAPDGRRPEATQAWRRAQRELTHRLRQRRHRPVERAH